MVSSMRSYSELPIPFCGYVIECGVDVLNLVPSKSVSTTPRELHTRVKPSLKFLRVWDCPTHVLKSKSSNLESRLNVYIFIGYSRESRAYLFYDSKERKLIVLMNVVFF